MAIAWPRMKMACARWRVRMACEDDVYKWRVRMACDKDVRARGSRVRMARVDDWRSRDLVRVYHLGDIACCSDVLVVERVGRYGFRRVNAAWPLVGIDPFDLYNPACTHWWFLDGVTTNTITTLF